MSYLVWFDSEHKPKTATESVLLFRNGKPVVKSGRPGMLMEAVQRCDWVMRWDPPLTFRKTREGLPLLHKRRGAKVISSPSVDRFLSEWTSDPPRGDWRRMRGSATRVRRYDGIPWWWGEVHPLPNGGRPEEMVPIIAQNASVLLGDQGSHEPAIRYGAVSDTPVPWLFEPFRGKALKARDLPPSRRYEYIRFLVEEAGSPESHQRTGMDLWAVLETVYHHYHPFPDQWQALAGLKPPKPPAYCFYAQDWWLAALIEQAWAIRCNVGAQRCEAPRCEVWFLRAGAQSHKTRYCSQHKGSGGSGAVMSYRQRLKTESPNLWGVMESRRKLKAKVDRGTLSRDVFSHWQKNIYPRRLELERQYLRRRGRKDFARWMEGVYAPQGLRLLREEDVATRERTRARTRG